MSNQLAQKSLCLARVTGELLKRASVQQEKQAAEATAIEKILPAALDACIQHERIFENQRDDVMQKLASSHSACIEFIRDLAAHKNAAEVAAIGQPQGGQVKKAGSPILRGGASQDFDATESGKRFAEKLFGG